LEKYEKESQNYAADIYPNDQNFGAILLRVIFGSLRQGKVSAF